MATEKRPQCAAGPCRRSGSLLAWPAMNDLLSDARWLLREAWQTARARWPFFFVALPAAMVLVVAFFFPRDVALADWCYADRSEFLREVARRTSAQGDFRLTLELFVFLVSFGIWKRRAEWRRLGLAILLAASLAGLVATSVRVTTGRPRPSAFAPDRFGGPELFSHKHQSFPSAHAATSMATAAVLLVGARSWWGVPFFLLSAGVPWARFYMHDHYLSDIGVGSLVGIGFGLALGLPCRRRAETYSAEGASR